MRLIDADECERYFYEHLDDNSMIGAMNAINEMPTVEPEIIRCKDCSHWKTLIMDVHKCDVLIWLTDAYDYCSFCAKERRQ